MKPTNAAESFQSIHDAIVKNHQSHIDYYNDNVDQIADLMCENVKDYLGFYGFYYDIRGNVGIMYISTDGRIRTHIIEQKGDV